MIRKGKIRSTDAVTVLAVTLLLGLIAFEVFSVAILRSKITMIWDDSMVHERLNRRLDNLRNQLNNYKSDSKYAKMEVNIALLELHRIADYLRKYNHLISADQTRKIEAVVVEYEQFYEKYWKINSPAFVEAKLDFSPV